MIDWSGTRLLTGAHYVKDPDEALGPQSRKTFDAVEKVSSVFDWSIRHMP
jgi:hypothetical protein